MEKRGAVTSINCLSYFGLYGIDETDCWNTSRIVTSIKEQCSAHR